MGVAEVLEFQNQNFRCSLDVACSWCSLIVVGKSRQSLFFIQRSH